jgi:hypothetical protein
MNQMDADDRADAIRFRWLCDHPDWHFLERLCWEVVADTTDEFLREMRRVIDARRSVELGPFEEHTRPAATPLTEEQIGKHTLLAGDCPATSAVLLVSSVRRLQARAAAPVEPAPAQPEGADAQKAPQPRTAEPAVQLPTSAAVVDYSAIKAVPFTNLMSDSVTVNPAEPAPAPADEPPTAFDYAANKGMAVTKEWCRGWDDCRAYCAMVSKLQAERSRK